MFFSQLGGLNFLSLCNYNIEKLPVKLSAFHKQMLLAWSLIYKHNFSPHSFFIWNNRNILYKNKSLFFQNWYNNKIILVRDLFNESGLLLSYYEFLQKFNFPVSPKEFAVVFDAVPSGVITLFKGLDRILYLVPPLCDPFQTTVGKACLVPHSSNKLIRALFQKEVVSKPYVIAYWSNFTNITNWKKVWLLPHKYLIVNKVREVSFKLIHRFYPVNSYLKKFKPDIDTMCNFCNVQDETIVHLFWHCNYTKVFWNSFCKFVTDFVYSKFSLFWKDVLFGFVDVEKNIEKEFYLINLLLLLAKYHIHKCKFSNNKPHFKVFFRELQQYFETLSASENTKARKTLTCFILFRIPL